MNHSKFKALALCSLAASCMAGQAVAHTGVRDTAVEGTSSYNAFTIGHGCGGESGDQYPVIGQAVAFPFGGQAVWRDGDQIKVGASSLISTAPVLHGPATSPNLLSLGVAGLAGGSPFATTQEIVGDNLGNVMGLLYKDGAIEPKLTGLTPFKVTLPEIVDPCVTLKVRIAVINYCELGKNEANDAKGPYQQPKDAFNRPIPAVALLDNKFGGVQTNVKGAPFFETLDAGNGDNNRADWWFGQLEGGSERYNDPDLLQQPSATSPAYWTTLTVVNKATDICNGTPREVTVEPSGKLVDRVLSGPNTRPFTSGNTNL